MRNLILVIVKPGGRIKSEIEIFCPMRSAATVLKESDCMVFMNMCGNYGQLLHICVEVIQQNQLIIKVLAETTSSLSTAFCQNKEVP